MAALGPVHQDRVARSLPSLEAELVDGEMSLAIGLGLWHGAGLVAVTTQRLVRVAPKDTDPHTLSRSEVSEATGSRGVMYGKLCLLLRDGTEETVRMLMPADSGPNLAQALVDPAHFLADLPEHPRASAPVEAVADELIKLASLRDQGVLTEEEFQAQKARLLET